MWYKDEGGEYFTHEEYKELTLSPLQTALAPSKTMNGRVRWSYKSNDKHGTWICVLFYINEYFISLVADAMSRQ